MHTEATPRSLSVVSKHYDGALLALISIAPKTRDVKLEVSLHSLFCGCECRPALSAGRCLYLEDRATSRRGFKPKVFDDEARTECLPPMASNPVTIYLPHARLSTNERERRKKQNITRLGAMHGSHTVTSICRHGLVGRATSATRRCTPL